MRDEERRGTDRLTGGRGDLGAGGDLADDFGGLAEGDEPSPA